MKMYLSLFLLVAVASCHALPFADSSLKTSCKQLLTASEAIKVWGQSLLDAANGAGLDEKELEHLESSASDINTKFTKAVQTVRDNLNGTKDENDDGTASSSKKIIVLLIADADKDKLFVLSKLALLSADRMVVDDLRLSIFLNLFQKRMKALDAAIEQLRELITKSDEEITPSIPGLIKDLVDQRTSLFLVFNAVKDSFQDAVVADSELGTTGVSTRNRREVTCGWSFRTGALSWMEILIIPPWYTVFNRVIYRCG